MTIARHFKKAEYGTERERRTRMTRHAGICVRPTEQKEASAHGWVSLFVELDEPSPDDDEIESASIYGNGEKRLCCSRTQHSTSVSSLAG